MSDKTIIGRYERVGFPEFDIEDVIAKVDTGAYTGAIFATHIRVEEAPEPRLYFRPFNNPDKEFNTTAFRKHWVRSSNGMAIDRYFIETNIKLNGKSYPIRIGLADRSSMRCPVLLGRRFLRRHGFVVDVSQDNR